MSSTIKAIIIDDSQQARKLIRLMLLEFAPEIEVLGEAGNVNEGLQAIETHKPDVLFLDIEMPEKSGLDLAEELLLRNIRCDVVFTTAYNEYAIKAFRLSAIDYLLKPIDEKQLLEAVRKIKRIKSSQETELRLQAMIQNFKNDQDAVLSVPSLNGYLFLKVVNILYIKASGSYTEISSLGKKAITVSKNLKYFEGALESFPQFVRVHRSYLINVHQLKKFDKADRGIIVMNDDAEIDLARERRDAFFKTVLK